MKLIATSQMSFLEDQSVERARHQNQSAQQMAEYLMEQPLIEQVLNPGQENRPDHLVAKWLFYGLAGMVSFTLKAKLEQTARFLDHLQIPYITQSLGGAENLVSQPHAMTGMMNWYRAFFRVKRQTTQSSRIQVPTLILWGKQDPHLSYEMARLSVDFCNDGHLITFDEATHWVLHDESEAVSQSMVEFFKPMK